MISLQSFRSPASASSLCDPILPSLSTPPLAPAHKTEVDSIIQGKRCLGIGSLTFRVSQRWVWIAYLCLLKRASSIWIHSRSLGLLRTTYITTVHTVHGPHHTFHVCCIARTPGPYMKLTRWHFNFVNKQLVFFREESGLQRNPTDTTTQS